MINADYLCCVLFQVHVLSGFNFRCHNVVRLTPRHECLKIETLVFILTVDISKRLKGKLGKIPRH